MPSRKAIPTRSRNKRKPPKRLHTTSCLLKAESIFLEKAGLTPSEYVAVPLQPDAFVIADAEAVAGPDAPEGTSLRAKALIVTCVIPEDLFPSLKAGGVLVPGAGPQRDYPGFSKAQGLPATLRLVIRRDAIRAFERERYEAMADQEGVPCKKVKGLPGFGAEWQGD